VNKSMKLRDFTSLGLKGDEGRTHENFEMEKTAHGKNIRRWCCFLLNGKKKYATQDV